MLLSGSPFEKPALPFAYLDFQNNKMRMQAATKTSGTLVKSMRELNMVKKFTLASFVILAIGTGVVAWWVGHQIELRILNETAASVQVHAAHLVAPALEGFNAAAPLTLKNIEALDQAVAIMRRGHDLVALKIWDTAGQLLYSGPSRFNPASEANASFTRARQGEVAIRINDLSEADDSQERASQAKLLETYVPIRTDDSGRVTAIVEFHEGVGPLESEILAAQLQTWFVIAAIMLGVYFLLVQFVRRANRTIVDQQLQLKVRLTELNMVMDRNEALTSQVRRASASVATINERSLRRIGAELHDGLAQYLSLALLRLDRVVAFCEAPVVDAAKSEEALNEIATIQRGLQQGLQEARFLSSGFMLPQLDNLTLAEALADVVQAHEFHTGTQVDLAMRDLPDQASTSVKITMYRFVQEGLNNAFRHAGGIGQKVQACCEDGSLEIEVSDQGSGFDPTRAAADGGEHLGLIGMRERVESLGGIFCIETQPGRGTRVFAQLPFDIEGSESELWYARRHR